MRQLSAFIFVTKIDMFVSLGDVLSSEAGNSIPLLAIIYAALSSMNSVGVSVYQEQLFKVISQQDDN